MAKLSIYNNVLLKLGMISLLKKKRPRCRYKRMPSSKQFVVVGNNGTVGPVMIDNGEVGIDWIGLGQLSTLASRLAAHLNAVPQFRPSLVACLELDLLAKLSEELLGDEGAEAHGLDATLEHLRHYYFRVAHLDR